MTEESGHQWKMTLGGEKDGNYMLCDQKSIELFQAFWHGINSGGFSLSEASAQCEESDKALSTSVALPGD